MLRKLLKIGGAVIAVLGAIASIVMAIGHISGASLANAMKLPETLPTGYVTLVIFILALALLTVSSRRIEVKVPEAKPDPRVATLTEELRNAQAAKTIADKRVQELQKQVVSFDTLKTRVVGILKGQSQSIGSLKRQLGVPDGDQGAQEELLNVLGSLAEEGRVTGRYGEYSLVEQP